MRLRRSQLRLRGIRPKGRISPRARLLRDEQGSVAIEFAFVAAVFLAILFGIMSYGFHFATRIALSYAVAEGGRAAVIGLDDTQRSEYAESAIREAVQSYSPLLRWENVTVLDPVWRDTGAGRAGDIAIDYDTAGRFSFLPFVPAPPETIRVSTTFVVADPGG